MEPLVNNPSYSELLSADGVWSSKLYFGPDDNLLLSGYSSAAGVTLALSYRKIDVSGRIVQNEQRLTLSSDRAVNTVEAFLGEGWLTHLQVRIVAGTITQPQVYATVQAQHGRSTVAMPWGLLAAGYLTNSQPLYWPGQPLQGSLDGPGAVRSITGTDPAAGVEISEAVPTGARWQLLALQAILTCDATVATRTIFWTFDDGTTEWFRSGQGIQPVANNVIRTSLGSGMAEDITTGAAIIVPVPVRVVLPAGSRINTVTSNLQAGDNWSAPQFVVTEWLAV